MCTSHLAQRSRLLSCCLAVISLSSARSPLILRLLLWKRRPAGDPASFYSPECDSGVAGLCSPHALRFRQWPSRRGPRFSPSPFRRWGTPCLLSCRAEPKASQRSCALSKPEENIRTLRGREAQPCPSVTLLRSQLLSARPHGLDAGAEIDGFYCQVVTKWMVLELLFGGHLKLLRYFRGEHWG